MLPFPHVKKYLKYFMNEINLNRKKNLKKTKQFKVDILFNDHQQKINRL
jgi:hypothetical protein